MGTTRNANLEALHSALVLACILVAAAVLLTACPGNNPPPVSQPPAGSKPTASKPPKKAPDTGGKATPGKAGDPAQPAGADGKDAEPSGPKVEVTDLLVDAPGVDFTGPGRYSITVSALLSEPWKPGVWDIVAYGEDGKKVGKQAMLLSMNHAKPKTLIFNDFYCTSIPVKIEILWTEKKADRSGEAGTGDTGSSKPGGGGKGGPSTGDSSKPPAKTPGGGGTPPPSGGGGTKPPPPSGDGGDGGGGGDMGE
jgi:hypothetical protein